jgi:hypothetical protein
MRHKYDFFNIAPPIGYKWIRYGETILKSDLFYCKKGNIEEIKPVIQYFVNMKSPFDDPKHEMQSDDLQGFVRKIV